MKIIARKEIYIERERRITTRTKGNQSFQQFCPECQIVTKFVTVDEAAFLRQTTAREIFRLVESNSIHAADTNEGSLLVCLASLENRNNQTKFE